MLYVYSLPLVPQSILREQLNTLMINLCACYVLLKL